MRGKVEGFGVRALGLGITPAYAGKRNIPWPADDWKRDHPRICGEKNSLKTERPLLLGSPPHMRGKAPTMPDFAKGVGITPAYAGKSIGSFDPIGRVRDHPRICGEKKGDLPAALRIWGSPPHMRGKVVRSAQCQAR